MAAKKILKKPAARKGRIVKKADAPMLKRGLKKKTAVKKRRVTKGD
jgi:hypothetical protein